MPPHANLERLIGAALVDGEFRATLLTSPARAATDFGLSIEEVNELEAANAGTLEELASHIYAWISRLPQPRRGVARRWAQDGHIAARVAV